MLNLLLDFKFLLKVLKNLSTKIRLFLSQHFLTVYSITMSKPRRRRGG